MEWQKPILIDFHAFVRSKEMILSLVIKMGLEWSTEWFLESLKDISLQYYLDGYKRAVK